jgi:hypothetical protein
MHPRWRHPDARSVDFFITGHAARIAKLPRPCVSKAISAIDSPAGEMHPDFRSIDPAISSASEVERRSRDHF